MTESSERNRVEERKQNFILLAAITAFMLSHSSLLVKGLCLSKQPLVAGTGVLQEERSAAQD